MAGMLTAAGLLLVRFRDRFSVDKLGGRFRKLTALAPLMTAGMVLVVGVGLTIRAVLG